MRKIFLIVLVVIATSAANAQFYKSFLPSPEFNSALEKIVLDFRLNYNTIKGDSIIKEGGMESFESTVKLPGSQNCNILYYSSRLDTTASWQATMYQGNDYKEAVRTYENLFRLVKKSRIRWIDRSSVGFKGELQSPKESLSFAVSTLTLNLDDNRYKRFEAEVELVSTSYEQYEVHLNLQARKNDDETF